jgi:hypothetical protein
MPGNSVSSLSQPLDSGQAVTIRKKGTTVPRLLVVRGRRGGAITYLKLLRRSRRRRRTMTARMRVMKRSLILMLFSQNRGREKKCTRRTFQLQRKF